MSGESNQESPQSLLISGFLDREPVVFSLHREEIEKIAEKLKNPGKLTVDNNGCLVDILGRSSGMLKGKLAEELVLQGYERLSQIMEISKGRVSVVRDAGEVVLKEGIYEDWDSERYRLVVSFRHVGQMRDIEFFREHLGEKHVPKTEALIFPGPQGPITLIVQEKVEGRALNEIEDLSELSDVQRGELLNLLRAIQETYEKTGRYPDIHGRPLKRANRLFRRSDVRHTDNIILTEDRAFLVDTDDIARNHSEETFKGWLFCKAITKRLSILETKLRG